MRQAWDRDLKDNKKPQAKHTQEFLTYVRNHALLAFKQLIAGALPAILALKNKVQDEPAWANWKVKSVNFSSNAATAWTIPSKYGSKDWHTNVQVSFSPQEIPAKSFGFKQESELGSEDEKVWEKTKKIFDQDFKTREIQDLRVGVTVQVIPVPLSREQHRPTLACHVEFDASMTSPLTPLELTDLQNPNIGERANSVQELYWVYKKDEPRKLTERATQAIGFVKQLIAADPILPPESMRKDTSRKGKSKSDKRTRTRSRSRSSSRRHTGKSKGTAQRTGKSPSPRGEVRKRQERSPSQARARSPSLKHCASKHEITIVRTHNTIALIS